MLGATQLGGAFGVGGAPEAGRERGRHPRLPEDAGPGVARRAREGRRPVVDGAPRRRPSHLLAELTAADGLVEVGYRDGERTRLDLVPAPLDERPGEEPLGEDSVLLVTGGARGITAEAAVALAERYRPTLVLVGRTPAGRRGGRGARRR